MERIRENQRKMPFSSSRRRSRGIVSKECSGIWKVENEGIDSIRERYRIKDHHRMNGRTRRGRLIANESSDESFDEEMAEERTMNKATLKIYDEVIGVPVPRRARSGLKRRPQDSVIAAQPSNASKGSREEMVPISESEVEVAKFLFGLARLNSQDSDAAADTVQSSSAPDISTLSKDSKRKKLRHIQTDENGKSYMTITCNSKSDGTTNQVNSNSSVPISSTSGQQAYSSSCIKEMVTSSPKLHNVSSPNNSGQTKIDAQFLGPQNSVPIPILAEVKPSPTSHINAKTLTSPDHHERPNSNASCKTQHEQTEQLSEMENQMKRDLLPLSPQNEKLDSHKSASSVSSVKDCGKMVKYEIDLMALPDDGEGDATDDFNPQVSDFNQGTCNDENTHKRGSFGLPDKLEIGDSKPKQNSACLHEYHTEGVRKEGVDKQPQIEAKIGSCQDDNNSDKIGAKQHTEKIVEDGELPSGRAGLSNVMTVVPSPNPISVPHWPGSIRPFGFPGTGSTGISVAPALQGTARVEGKTLTPHAPFVMLPPTRPGHCVTHCFIARLIHFQQQLVKLNPLWQAAGSSDKPYMLFALPQPGALVLGGPVIRNSNATIGSSVVSLNCQYPAPNHSDSLKDAGKGRHLLFQQAPQGGVFLFPINQMQSQTAGQKASHLPTSSASLASTGNSCNNLASVPDPRYLTMFKGSYPFPTSSAYQSCTAQQQRQPIALIPGSSSSSQPFSQPLQLIPNPSVLTVSSSQKYIQANHFLHSCKIPSEVHLINKPEHSGNCEVSHSQGPLQNYSIPAGKHCQPLSLLANQLKTLPKAQSSRSRGPSEWNHLRNQAVAQTHSPISTLSTLVSTSSIASSDRNNLQQGMSSLQKMPKPQNYLENTSITKDTTIPSLTTAAKTQQTLFSTLVPGQQNKLQLTFPGSLNMRKPTISQQAHHSSSMGLTTVAAVPYVQGSASLPMKSTEQKPATG